MTKQTELYVSLGHNSSAVLAEDGVVVSGYEQERFDKKKSSSAFPIQAIAAAMGRHEQVDRIYLSHWFDQFTVTSNKYVDMPTLLSFSKEIFGLSPENTHHDAHARSAISFLNSHGRTGDAMVFVMDGFGNRQECFSVYEWREGSLVREHRTNGYMLSLGLMYQYVTDYLGLKMNQDEYKLLGYEAHVAEYVPRDYLLEVREKIKKHAVEHAHIMLRESRPKPVTHELIDYAMLNAAKIKWKGVAHTWRNMFGSIDQNDNRAIRACVAFCAQTFLEEATVELIDRFVWHKDLRIVLTGGCFYNVKLNRRIQVETGCRVFAHPLAGDQGAAMGVSENPPKMTTLCIGQREYPPGDCGGGLAYVPQEKWPDYVSSLVYMNKIVNVWRGNMEFGPRALCHTSTFALPTRKNVRIINDLNARDDAMPMAPVMTPGGAAQLLRNDELEATDVSNHFMITTCAFKEPPDHDFEGVAHKDPLENVWTARPQITYDPEVGRLLDHVPKQTLINTSFNFHGTPIVFTVEDAARDHARQCVRAMVEGHEEPVTVVVLP